ncbi:MAG: TVP38/TMEM64 family protein [Candidatus Omnitrophica bacterium]|nr:TVP38/TMEM64 family protein [Candidatus Omnitrophota bacterium]
MTLVRPNTVGRPTWLKLSLLALVAVGIYGIARIVGFDVRQMTPERVRGFVLSFGIWAPAIYLLAYGQPLVPLPASVMTITGGLAFGPAWGTLAALVGATLRACSEFLVARLLGREAVVKLLKGKAATLDQRIGEHGFQAVLLIRLIPSLPFDMLNYGLGFSRVRFAPYALASFLGMIPGSFAYVYLGYSLTDPRQFWKLGLAILLIVGLILAQRAWSKRHRTPVHGDRR